MPQVPDKDPWEGEQFEIVGKIAYAMIPVLVLGAIGVGLFASQTYNEGSTIFLVSGSSRKASPVDAVAKHAGLALHSSR